MKQIPADYGLLTRSEILQQPELWPDTWNRVRGDFPDGLPLTNSVVVTGAGTSAYAAEAVATAWPGAHAIPTTDLLLATPPAFREGGLLLSLARSGDSPESIGSVARMQRECPSVRHLAITCNAKGKLAQAAGVKAIVLDPRTNDQSLAMTSSFSNLVLAGLCLRECNGVGSALSGIAERVSKSLFPMDHVAEEIAQRPLSRMMVLGCRHLFGAAREASLKVLEMTAGHVTTLPETFLGLRHGPMAFLRQDALVLCFLSADEKQRPYEEDLLGELRAKKLGRVVAIAPPDFNRELCDYLVPANAWELKDYYRTPFEIVFAQLLAYRLSLAIGLNPDNPSPNGVINRVVQGVRIHDT